jgi:hypothetical protein
MLEPYKAWRINEAIARYYDGAMTAEDAFIIIAYVINYWR